MRFLTDHAGFARALATVARAVPTRTTLPVLTGVLLRAEGARVSLTASDLDLTIECSIAADVAEDGAVVLPARYLTELVRRIPGGELRWSAPTDRPTARLEWQRSEFSLQGFGADQFPSSSVGGVPSEPFPLARLRMALAHAVFAASSDTARPVLTGVSLSIDGDDIQAIATDGTRVSLYRDPPDRKDWAAARQLLVPARGLQELLRCLDAGSEAGEIAMAVHDRQLAVGLGDTHVTLRLLEGRYPAVLDLLPGDYPTAVHADRRQLHDACERVSLIADSPEHLYAVRLDVESDGVRLAARNAEVGEASEEVSAHSTGPALQVGFNARLLLDGLRHLDGDDVTLEISGTDTAARMFSDDGGAFVYVQMPVRMS